MPRDEKVGVGTAVIVFDSLYHKVLLLKRAGAHQAGKWSCPGGWIDSTDESVKAACIRELEEETGLKNIMEDELIPLDNTTEYHKELDIRAVTAYYLLWYDEQWHGKPEILEPKKCSDMQWFSELPENHFPKLDQAWSSLEKRVSKL